MLRDAIAAARANIDRALAGVTPQPRVVEIGTVVSLSAGVARVRGLPSLGAEELVEFPGEVFGMAVELERDEAGVVLLGPHESLTAGATARAARRLVDAPVGDALLGRVIDAMGRPLDNAGEVRTTERRPAERPAPAILDRAPVRAPLQTGLKVVDALIPIGRGQRELIVGDRQTGKSALAVDVILNQRGLDVVCVYCAIGQRGTAVARVIDTLRKHDALAYTIVVVAEGDDAAGLQFITPYAATTMAEYFMERGRDVLIVYDDLTRHARAYRELSLLLRRPPGREAFPGDIFYIHSRLLERATHLTAEKGGGSLTALPIVETQAEDISAYIPTNLISITDGQIYLSPELFRKGMLPAADVGKSVSRVGGKAQLAAYRAVAADLRLSYAQFEELETFARFATRLDPDTRSAIERGRRVREILKQPEQAPLGVAQQLASLYPIVNGLFDSLPLEKIAYAEAAVREAAAHALPELFRRIDSGETLSDGDWRELKSIAERAIAALEPTATAKGGGSP